MKLILLFLILHGFHLHASIKQTVLCLAKEEDKYHKKQTEGPFYNLNQKLINKLVNYDPIKIQPDIVKKVCDSKYAGAFILIEQYILYPNEFFVTLEEIQEKKSLRQKRELEIFFKQAFIELLMKSQEYSGTTQCFKKVFPSVAKLFDKIKYTQVDNNLVGIIDQIKNKRDLLAKLWNVPGIFNQCQKPKKR